MKCKILFFAMVTTVMTSREDILQILRDDPDDKIVSCADSLAKEYFDQSQNVAILSRQSVKSMHENFMDFAKIVVNDPYLVFSKDSVVAKDAVFFLEKESVEPDFQMLSSTEKFHPRGRYIIGILSGKKTENSTEYLTKIAKFFAAQNKSDVLLLTSAYSHGKVRVYSYTDHNYENCGKVQLVDYGPCKSEETIEKIFSRNLNFNQCPIRLAVQPFPRLVEIYKVNGRTKASGLESQMMDWLVQKLNATAMILEKICVSEEEIREDDSDDCSITSVRIKWMIKNAKADIGWGFLMQRPAEGIAYTDSYLFLHARMMVPRIEFQRLWTNLIKPLQKEVWISLAFLIFSTVTLKTLVPPLRREFPMRYIVSSFLGYGAPRTTFRVSHRIYFLSWIWFAYIIMQAYLASLTGLYTKPSQKLQIQTLKQLDETDLPVGGFPSMREQFRETTPRIYRAFQVMEVPEYFENFEKLKLGRKAISTHVADLQMMSMSTGPSSEHYHVIPEVINFYPIAALMPETSAILPFGNRVIRGILEGGIFELMKQKVRAESMMTKEGGSLEEDNGTRRITLADLQAVFFMLAVGVAVSSVTLLIELIFANLRSLQFMKIIHF